MTIDRRKFLTLSAAVLAAPVFAPHVARAATRTLRVAHSNSATSGFQVASVAFQQYVTEKSEGRYKADIYPNAQLGNDVQLVKSVSEGTLDMTFSGTGLLGAYNGDVGLVELPYLFKDVNAARSALDRNLGAHYTELLQKNSIAIIGWGENGVRHITANKPIRTPAELKGVKIRVQPAKLQVESFAGLGADAGPLNFSELPEALRTGRFEAQENPISQVVTNDFLPKMQSHLSLTGHVYSPMSCCFSSDVLEDMSPADRAIIKAAGMAAVKATRDFSDDAASTGLDKLKAVGMKIVTDVDRAQFEKAMVGLNDRLAAIVGADAMARVRGLVA